MAPSNDQRDVIRQRPYIAQKYEGVYYNLLHYAAQFIAGSRKSGPETYRDLVLELTALWSVSMSPKPVPAISVDDLPPLFRAFLSEPAKWLAEGHERSGTRAEFIHALDDFFARTIRTCAGKPDLVLDLGCGWGHRMVDAYLAGVDAQFVGGDRSQHTAQIIALLGQLFPKARLGWFGFDFVRPDFSALPQNYGKVCLFTCHAIEQVTNIGRDMFDALFDRFSQALVTGIHLEPLAFQFDPSREDEKKYAIEHRYNSDLLSVLRNHPDIRIKHVEAVAFESFDHNPTSLVVWERLPSKGSQR